jgi:SAM-dependent methyltransferase
MRQDDRGPFVTALEHARADAYATGQYVGQESFMRADEIREIADRADIRAGDPVLDVCCGVAGPGRLIAAESRCRYTGVDYSASALEIARTSAGDLPCRFELMQVPPLPRGRFEVVLLLETMLAFPDKHTVLEQVARALGPGGRFAFTVEAGAPLTRGEQEQMPDADTVWLIELDRLTGTLREVGLPVSWTRDCTASHRATAAALLGSFRRREAEIVREVGGPAFADLVRAHELWVDWMGSGRVRKFAAVAEKR